MDMIGYWNYIQRELRFLSPPWKRSEYNNTSNAKAVAEENIQKGNKSLLKTASITFLIPCL